MASISLTDPVAGTTVTAGLHAGNNAALRTAINGGLDNTNVTAGAAIVQSKISFDAWAAYTPTWAALGVAPVLNNGTLVGKFAQVGKTVFARIVLTAGAATTFGTLAWSFTLPVTAAAAEDGLLGNVAGDDSSAAGWFPGTALFNSTTTFTPVTLAQPAAVYTNLAPFAWATADKFVAHLMYEAA